MSNMLRIERFDFRQLHGGKGEGAVRGYMPPSLIEEPVQEPPPPPPPSFSEEQMKQAEQEGYRRGFMEGEAEGRKQMESVKFDIDRKLAETVQDLSAPLAAFAQQYKEFIIQQKTELPKLAYAIARRVADDALNENAFAVIEARVIKCLEEILGVPHVTIVVNAQLADALRERISAHFAHAEEPTEIVISGDDNLNLSDFRMVWKQGAAERDTDELWKRVEALVADLSVTERTDAQTEFSSPLPPSAS